MAVKKCVRCGKERNERNYYDFEWLEGELVCDACYADYANELAKDKVELEEKIQAIILTTTNNVDGFKVIEYIGIVSVEVVIGTGAISEFTANIADFFGTRATKFEKKLKQGKDFALMKLKADAYQKGGNAVIGIDMDYTEFSGNKIGVVANGTVVKIVPKE